MFTEELTLIRNAENDADQQKKDARLEAATMTEAAYAEATKIVNAAEKEAKEKYDMLIAEGEKIADEEYADAIAKAQKTAEEMANKALDGKPSVASYIVERIVKNSVNC